MAGQSATRVAVLWELPAFEFAYILHGQTGGCGNANDQGPNGDAVEQVGPVLSTRCPCAGHVDAGLGRLPEPVRG
jgi:hypothetical protein